MTEAADIALALEPYTLKGLRLRNRIVRTAHGTNLGRGTLNEALIAYHEARARGGVALSLLEATGVHPSGPMTLNAWDDTILPRYRELAARVHAQGMAVFSQLNHLGLELGAPGAAPWSASPLVSPTTGLRAIAMDSGQIAAVVDGFAAAARRARDGGLDGVEVHCAHGHLLQQFLSPLTNHREDAYGGDAAGRARFLREVLQAVRDAVGQDFILGLRVGPQDLPGGLGVDEHIALVRGLEAEGRLDYLSVSLGSLYNPHRIIGGMHEPAGYELPTSAPVTAATRLPTMVTGRLRTLAEAGAVLRRGIADLVGMTRAHIADPDLIAKTVAGRAHEVRPCIACNQGCVGGLARGRLGCTVNARAGREAEPVPPPAAEAAPRRLLVIGGGPAGMEAARVARERGFRATLVEAGAVLGGTLQVARRAPHHAAIGDIADWLAREMTRLDVDVRLQARGDAALAAQLGIDAVLVATGSQGTPSLAQRHLPGAPGDGAPSLPVLTARQLLADGAPAGVREAVVLDELGTYEAVGAAEWLVERGIAVQFVTGLSGLAPRLAAALVPAPALARLRRGPFTLSVRAALLAGASPRAGHCRLGWLDGGEPWDVPAQLLVVAAPGHPDLPLVAALEAAGVPQVAAIGDARATGTLEEAIRAANAAVLALG